MLNDGEIFYQLFSGKLMQGIKHALAYTKSSEVISSALALLKVLDSPQLITQVWFLGN